ncbi:MAG: hypothetical protein Q9195_000576 [Heterodermia aff. obscurata]
MLFRPIIPICLMASTAHAYWKGFNLGATVPSGACKTQADWTKDFQVLASLPGHFTSARVYAASDCNTLATAVPAAVAAGTSLLVGVWTEDAAHYDAEKAALLAVIQQYGFDWMVAVSVGSEDLYRGDTSAETLASQIDDVRGMLWSVGAGAIKVGHVDTWTAWVNPANNAVITASDFIGTDGYPYFQDASINDGYNVFWQSVTDVGSMVAQVKPGTPIWITETGWPVGGGAMGAAMPSVNNAHMYWESVACVQKFSGSLWHEELKQNGGHLEQRSSNGILPPITLPGLFLTLGGGLLNGVLQPFTGRLSLLVPPTPQSFGLKAIPGTDANHQYVAPGTNDQRGACPALNTLANHGYISRDGITTWAEAANAIQTAFGFGYDLASILSGLGVIAGGDLITGKYSIGGADSRVPDTLGPSLGLDKHGVCEVDNSIARVDTFFGAEFKIPNSNQANFHLDRWQALLEDVAAHGNLFSQAAFTDEKKRSYDDSRATNPHFDAGPKWYVIAHGERVFVYRNMLNGTSPGECSHFDPNQIYTGRVVVVRFTQRPTNVSTDTAPDFGNVGPFFLNETFPKNWFRRPTPFPLADFLLDITSLYLGSPVELGANEGLGNFVPLGTDPSAMTPSQIACFVLANILDEAPGSVAINIVNNYNLIQGFLNGAVAPFFANYNCDLTDYTVPSASAGEDTTGSSSDDGPAIVNGVYQRSNE